MFRKIILSFFLVSLSLMAQESNASAHKHRLSICATFKDEAKYLKEWIEYHCLVGVDHFYLYNIGSRDQYMRVLSPYLRQGIVTLVNWPKFTETQTEEEAFKWVLSNKIPAYENAIKVKAANQTKWLVFLDIDEYLVPPNVDKLSETLENYDEYPGVILGSDFFDSSKRDAFKKKLVIEALNLVAKPERNLQKGISKMIFKPDQCVGFTWPPYQCSFKNQERAIKIRKGELRINSYIKGNQTYYASREKLAVDNRVLSEEEMTTLLELGYEIEDQDRAIFRFIPVLRKNMGFETGWEIITGEGR